MRRAVRLVLVASIAALAVVVHDRRRLRAREPPVVRPRVGRDVADRADPADAELLRGTRPSALPGRAAEQLRSRRSRPGTPTLQGHTTLVVPITGDMPDGVYTVSWSAVSVDDGHTTTDSFSFGVGVKARLDRRGRSCRRRASGPTVLGVVGKALLYAGLMLVVAVAVVGEGVFGGAPKARPGSQPGPDSHPSWGRSGCCVAAEATRASIARFLGSAWRGRRSRWSSSV